MGGRSYAYDTGHFLVTSLDLRLNAELIAASGLPPPREIHYRVLTSDLAARLWRIASVGSQSRRVAKSIDWLKANYRQPLHIEDLAAHVQMSPSSLHHHFRQLTAMSPLQFNRECARLFGAPPKRDVGGLRQPAADASARREVASL